MKRPQIPPEEVMNGVREVYAELTSRPVQRACVSSAQCCQFRLTGRTPYLTRGEALVLAKAVRASGRKELPAPDDGSCPLLDRTGKCLAYENRPFGCRTHFCATAGGPYVRREVLDLIRRLEDLDRKCGGDGARPIGNALEQAFRSLAAGNGTPARFRARGHERAGRTPSR